MTVYVMRNGLLVEKRGCQVWGSRGDFPTPMLSRMEPFASPVTGKEISSWRERDRDMAAAGACDPRDLPAPTRGRKANGRGKQQSGAGGADFKWGGAG